MPTQRSGVGIRLERLVRLLVESIPQRRLNAPE
jgi:hypothetical protein